MAAKPKPDVVLYLLELLSVQQQEINDLRARLDQMDAAWPDIVEVEDGVN